MSAFAHPAGVDPLIAEAKRRTRRRRLLIASFGIVVALVVALTTSYTPARRTVPPLSTPKLRRYSVTTIVAYTKPGRQKHPAKLPAWQIAMATHPLACESSLLMTDEPGGGCGGVPLTGNAFQRFRQPQRFPDGGWQTSFLNLVGTWDGHLFHVTSAIPATVGTGPSQPNCLAHQTGPVVRVSDRELTEAEAHTQIFDSGPCGHTYSFLVPVADHRTVARLQRQFGKSILVTGWLQPVRS